MYKNIVKRVLDIIVSVTILLLIGWFLLLVAVVLHFANKGAGVFFTQLRPGKGGEMFKMVKFKSMTDDKDADGNLLPNDQRITPMGRFIRKTSIDELPQLFNVVKGDMSLVGPRPLMPRYLELYSPEQARRHEVRPGITGWAQCHGRNNISWTEKFKLDVWYVDHCSLKVDVKVILLTAKNVLARKDVQYGGNSDNSEGFNGHN